MCHALFETNYSKKGSPKYICYAEPEILTREDQHLAMYFRLAEELLLGVALSTAESEYIALASAAQEEAANC